MKKQFLLLNLGLALVASSACGRYSHTTPELDKAAMKAQPYVYGDPDGEPKQHKNIYPTNPDAATEAAVLKQKMFAPEASNAYVVDTAAALRANQE